MKQLLSNTAIRLDIDGARLGSPGVKMLASALWINKSVESLLITGFGLRGIGDEGCIALSEALKQSGNVLHLDLSGNRIADRGVESLASFLNVASRLQNLVLSRNDIGPAGANSLALALLCVPGGQPDGAIDMVQDCSAKTDRALKLLDLSTNNIGAVGARELSRLIAGNIPIQYLNLSDNDLFDRGAVRMARALESNTSLLELALSRNSITDKGAAQLARVLAGDNTALQALHVECNYIGNSGASDFREAMGKVC